VVVVVVRVGVVIMCEVVVDVVGNRCVVVACAVTNVCVIVIDVVVAVVAALNVVVTRCHWNAGARWERETIMSNPSRA
jgi:hypothetical protein